MFNNYYRNFVLDNCLAAVSAVPECNETLATDGANCKIYEFDINGCLNRCRCTLRPYRRLRQGLDCGYTATGCCNSNRFYFLNESFHEQGFVKLSSEGGNCCSSSSPLTDASVTVIDSQNYIIGAFFNGAFLFDFNGQRVSQLCKTENGEALTDFVSLGNRSYAMATLCGNTQTISVIQGDNLQTAIVPSGYTLRMLIPMGNVLLALFGKNYIYNRIIKIYSDGILTLPRT